MDTKITALPTAGAAALTQIFEVVTDPSGTPVSEKLSLTQIKTLLDTLYQAKALFVQTNVVTLSNSSALTSLIGTGVGTNAIPANTMVAGSAYRVRAGGTYEDTGAFEHLNWELGIAGQRIAGGAINAGDGIGDQLAWFLDCDLVYHAGGTIHLTGTMSLWSQNDWFANGTNSLVVNISDSWPINSAISNSFSIMGQWSANSGALVVRTNNYTFEKIA